LQINTAPQGANKRRKKMKTLDEKRRKSVQQSIESAWADARRCCGMVGILCPKPLSVPLHTNIASAAEAASEAHSCLWGLLSGIGTPEDRRKTAQEAVIAASKTQIE
jgi:hypothetical protein